MPLRVIITGASSGIGTALAKYYAQRGAILGLIARRRAELEQLKTSLASAVEIYPADVRDTAALQVAAADFIAKHGVPDIVIANAGVSVGTLTQMPEDIAAAQDVFDINVMGLIKTFQPYIEPMRKAGGGILVGIASVAGYRGLPGSAAYSASKAAAISYLESLRVELKQSGIRVVTICPGYIATPMTAKNPYPMPFLIDADTAARKFARVIDSGKNYAVVPWQMAIVARVLRVIPNWIYDRLFLKVPRKLRRTQK
ncbi:MAG TPA: SDR family oxidoreductase [Burkholderiales bacterium]|nr:SDR family oxidoreductase [Burkholderiales bacterium]